jgi:GR25 family glycosyltransferase involved in LPS biosynthesis
LAALRKREHPVNQLVSKPYFPGAHAYMLKPAGAKAFIAKAHEKPLPTDIFINKVNFPWLEEYYPWPVEARDTFTTIQKVEGCLAKHNYNDDYKII